nr:glycosyltransferase family 4 protein [Carnobacterium inhibens]
MNIVKNNKVKLLFVGRLVESKGIENLIEVLPMLNRNDFELNVIGEGYLLNDLIKKVQLLGLQNKVFFRGYLEGEALLKYYRESNIFILPSLSEPYGLVMLEAMCNSLSIICSDYVDSHPDLIEHNLNGLIYNPLDNLDFEKKINYLLNNKGLIEKMGNESYKKALKYSIENSALLFKNSIVNQLN